MTPIEKNIHVVDAQGNTYEATYPKRAKGLVKNGRARFVDEHTICLACPPNPHLEDKIMSENMEHIREPETVTAEETSAKSQAVEAPTPEIPTMAYCLQQIEAIRVDRNHLTEALRTLESTVPGGPGDIVGAERAKAVGEIVKAHEETNQRLIAFYEKMYDDLKPKNSLKDRALDFGGAAVLDGHDAEAVASLIEAIRHIG